MIYAEIFFLLFRLFFINACDVCAKKVLIQKNPTIVKAFLSFYYCPYKNMKKCDTCSGLVYMPSTLLTSIIMKTKILEKRIKNF